MIRTQQLTRPVGRPEPLHRTRSPASGRTWQHRALLGVAALLFAGLVGTGVTFWLQGYRVYVVYTGSMTPTLRPGDVIIDRPASSGVRVGDIITFTKPALRARVVTHRVAAVTATGITTKGDANRTADASVVHPDEVRGTVAYRVPALGYLVVYFREPAGIASIGTTVIAIVLLWRLFFPTRPPTAAARITAPTE